MDKFNVIINEISTILGFSFAGIFLLFFIFKITTLPYYAKGPGLSRREVFSSTEAKKAYIKLANFYELIFLILMILTVIKLFPLAVGILGIPLKS